jgi:predicted dehydrogenase
MNLSEPLRLYDKQVTEQRSPGFVDTFASFRTSIHEGDILIPRVSTGEPLKAECDHFLECIAGRAEPLNDGAGGLRVLEALEAANASMNESSRMVALPV